MVAIPLAETIARTVFSTGVPGSSPLLRHLTLWVCFLGSALAASQGKLLSFATGELLQEGRFARIARIFSSTVASAIAALLCVAAIELVQTDREGGGMVTTWLPVWVAQLVIPVSFALIALRLAWRASNQWRWRGVAVLGIAVGVWLGVLYYEAANPILEERPALPGILLILAATFLGGPIFAALGGIAALLFMRDGVGPVAVLAETYRLAVNPTLPSLPLFTLVGFLLAEGRASERLLRVFRAFFGWMPGGTAVVCILLCAFFTIPTGGSGVTILALGALLLQALQSDGYKDRFSLGLLTASGSLGLLFAPALPLILYGIVAQIPIENLFYGGLIPGLLLVGLMAAWGIREGIRSKVPRQQFNLAEARDALIDAKWEVLLPVIALGAIFGGFATLVEAAALTVTYTFITQCFVHRDLSLRHDIPGVLVQCLVLMGGVLLILGVALGFTSYMVDAQITEIALEWVQSHISSRLLFLLCLNLFLLLVGCVMDIFSATVVVVPLIIPMGLAYGIDPVHMGIIFIANLELGYLTPPVGLNLFFASYRFERPLLQMYRAAVPFLLILAIGVLLITYLPWLTEAGGSLADAWRRLRGL